MAVQLLYENLKTMAYSPAAPVGYSGSLSPPQGMYQLPMSMSAASSVPTPPQKPGTLPVGTRIMIGTYKVTIDRFLSEGGFAHVYVVTSSTPITVGGSAQSQHVLKRLAVPDKGQLQEVRKEVENMKRVSGHPHIVNFIEASASQLPNNTGYEVFILMEYVSGGGIIDMMNTRLQNRLTESEILKIFSDTTEAVAHMHHLKPPMMHRDLKVENILMASTNSYKLCDFGSATVPSPKAPSTMQDIQALEEDLNRTTTLQYRSPEMLDVWARKHVGLPADVWALGVFLYKLCYYTTPFEPHGVLAIQNVNYSFPRMPAYSNSIKDLIASMLQGDANRRPTVDKILQRVYQLRGVPSKSTVAALPTPSSHSPPPSLPRRPKGNLLAPSSVSSSAPPNVLAPVRTPDSEKNQLRSLADAVAPMRRGRPTPSKGTASAKSDATLSTGFDNSFEPSAAEASARRTSPRPPSSQLQEEKFMKPKTSVSEFTDFESQFPALEDSHSVSSGRDADTYTLSSKNSDVSAKPTPAPQIQRHASGFKDLLAPTPTASSPPVSTSSPSSLVKSAPSGTVDRQTTSSSSRSDPPPKPPKPQFVDSASQTSPILMERWYHERLRLSGEGDTGIKPSEMRKQPRRPLSFSSQPQRLVSVDKSPVHREPNNIYRPPASQQDLLGDSPPPSGSRSISRDNGGRAHSDAIQQVQNALPTLRSNYLRNGSMSTNDPPTGVSNGDDITEAMQRFQPLSSDGPDDQSGPSVQKMATWATDTTSDSDDSQENQGPEDLGAFHKAGVRHVSISPEPFSSAEKTPPAASFDVSSQRSQPRPPPELVAPVPRQHHTAISDLVSRYEDLESPLAEQALNSTSTSRRRPVSMYGASSNTRSPISPQGEVSSTPTGITSAASFKPRKPAPGPKPSTTFKPSVELTSAGESGDRGENEDQPFVGVTEMRKRWQTGSLQRASSGRASSNTEGGAGRQEWRNV